MAIDTDNLLSLIREQLATACKVAPHVPSIKNAADAFRRLDEALCGGGDLPEDWLTDPVDDIEDDLDDDPADDDEASEAESIEEMKRLQGGG